MTTTITRGGYRVGAGRKKGFSALEAEKARNLICKKLEDKLTPIVEMAIKGEYKNLDQKEILKLLEF